jgi:hypothetical protein
MKHFPATKPQPASRARQLLWSLAGSALVAVLTQASWQELAEAQATESAPASVARFRLEERAGRFYRPGGSVAFTGWVMDYSRDGALRLRSAMVNGQLHGRSEGWFANGMIELREYFQQGRPHGSRTTWHLNGQKRSEGWLVAGQQQGRYCQWSEDGALVAEADFKDGKPHGISRAWYPSGCLKAEALMKNGDVQTRHFYPDGIQHESTLIAGVSTR